MIPLVTPSRSWGDASLASVSSILVHTSMWCCISCSAHLEKELLASKFVNSMTPSMVVTSQGRPKSTERFRPGQESLDSLPQGNRSLYSAQCALFKTYFMYDSLLLGDTDERKSEISKSCDWLRSRSVWIAIIIYYIFYYFCRIPSLPSGFIPTSKHFRNLQARHRFWCLTFFNSQAPSNLHRYCLWVEIERRQKDLHPKQLKQINSELLKN